LRLISGRVGALGLQYANRLVLLWRRINFCELVSVRRALDPLGVLSWSVVVRNCNNFMSQIADTVGLHVPMVTAQFPVHYVAELRALDSR